MANNDQVSQEYLLIKCFLYKYTPPFSQVDLPPTASNDFSLSTFTPYSVPLDDTTYFTKYDISQFVTDYSFAQNLDETTYSWSVTLQDLALSYGTINSKLKVNPPTGSTLTGGLSFSNANSSDSLGLLAEFESSANTFDNNDYTSDDSANPILNAKFQRGMTPGPLTVQNSNLNRVLSTVPGLRLSDLIQEYDFISVFLYHNTTPLTDIYGTVVLNSNAGSTNTTTGTVSTGFSAASASAPTSASALQNNPLYVFNYAFTDSDQISFGNAFNKANFQTLSDANLQYESILMANMPNGKTLFTNELNGFVMIKALNSAIDQVDKLVIGGNGWSRLFGATRRAIKTSLFANALYQAGQVTGLTDVTPFENIFAGQPISKIIQGLFDSVYRIDFNVATSAQIAAAATPINPNNSTNLATSDLDQDGFFANPQGLSTTGNDFSTTDTSSVLLGSSFFNVTSLVVGNAYPANMFSVPPYLLSTVMKLRPFAYIEPISFPVSDSFITAAQATASQLQIGASTATGEQQVSPETFQQAMQSIGGQVVNYGATSPVFIDPTVQNLKAYFRFLDTVFLSFAPEVQTPFEILDHIRSIAFVEIYEQPNGQFVVRAPQYNNMAESVTGRSDISMIRSSNLNIISSTYSNTVENLVSKILTGYSPEMLAIGVLQQFGYCDGKLLTQIGQLEMETAANPNATTASLSNTTTNNSKTTGIFGWAEYLMELTNAKRKTGSVTCDLDSSIQVGNTFIDETKFKFGYIVGLTKHVAVTGTASMALSLSYVRDAVPVYSQTNNVLNASAITSINTDLLPVLSDIENSFASGS
jgi:hypothetical protein